MKFLPLTASLLALTLFAAPAFTQEAQPADPAAEVAAPQIPEEVLVLLNDQRPLSELSADELGDRAKQARKFSKMDGLAPEMRDQLQAIAQAARGEIAAREELATQPAAPAVEQAAPAVEQPVEAPKAVEAPVEQPVEQPPAEVAAPEPAEIPPDVAKLLNDQRPLGELTDDELASRFKLARQFSKAKKLPGDTKAQLADIVKSVRAEMLAREQAAQTVPEPLVQPETAAQPPIVEQPPVAEQPPVVEQPPIAEQAPAIEQPPVAETQPPAAAPPTDTKQAQQLDGNAAVPEAEAKAKLFLEDATPADKLSDEDLRKRLDGIRELMAGNELSRDTERALRKKLRVERDILRNRVAVAETAEPPKKTVESQPTAEAQPAKPSKFKKNDYIFNIEIVLNDNRPSDELQDYELSRRLEVYRQASRDQRYDQQHREYWREVIVRDEDLLQRRLLRERRQRQAELQDSEYEVELSDEYDPDLVRDDVYAAEVDDEELEDVLVAPPRRKLDRRYSIEEVEASPELREAMPRVEIDTVHFGFNEAFVRAEEVENLDRIAEIIERILSKHPRERFVIEGHTDAVGSDASNLALSRQRSAAIKKALTTYYVIPERNLQTIGLGERYLKIPTAEAEQENRRVSVSRGTLVLGEVEE